MARLVRALCSEGREEDLVFEPDVSFQLSNKARQTCIEGAPRSTGVLWGNEPMRNVENARNRCTMFIVIATHRCDGVFNSRCASIPDRWKEDQFLFLHVNFEFPGHAVEQLGQSSGDVR